MWTNITLPLQIFQQSNDEIAFYFYFSIKHLDLSFVSLAITLFVVITCFAHKMPFSSFSIGPIFVNCLFQKT